MKPTSPLWLVALCTVMMPLRGPVAQAHNSHQHDCVTPTGFRLTVEAAAAEMEEAANRITEAEDPVAAAAAAATGWQPVLYVPPSGNGTLMAASFGAFRPKVRFYWDGTTFYEESDNMPNNIHAESQGGHYVVATASSFASGLFRECHKPCATYPWTITSNGGHTKQTTAANHGTGNICGLEFGKGSATAAATMVATTNPINATGTAGTLQFRAATANLTDGLGWNFQIATDATGPRLTLMTSL